MMEQHEHTHDLVMQISALVEAQNHLEVKNRLANCHSAEIAHVLESLPPEQRHIVWQAIAADTEGNVLLLVNDDVRSGLIESMGNDELIAAAENLETDDLADIIPDLPETVTDELLRSMDKQDRQRLESVLQFPEDTAGGMMNVDTITLRPDVSLDVVLRYIRFRGNLPEMTDNLFVVGRDNKFLGAISVSSLLTHAPSLTVAEVLNTGVKSITANTSSTDVAKIFQQRDLVSAPVTDENEMLLGRITIDDVVDIIRDQADHTFLSHAGLDEEDDMFAPVVLSTRRRSVWLGVNLLTALLASWVIGQFDATIEKLVALAVLMPIVASMGGIAGSQTLTLVIRGMATGTVVSANRQALIRKEILIGILNGILWSLVVGLIAYAWFDNTSLGLIIGAAILFNLIIAAIAGATIPLVLRKLGADPALAGSVVLTTITDVAGFFAFLGLAAAFLV